MHSVHLIYTAEVCPEDTEAFKPASSGAGTHSADELAKDDLTVCHQRMLGVSVSVLYINSVSYRVYVCDCVYNMSLENPAYNSATISASSECVVKCFVLSTAPPPPNHRLS